MGIVDAELPQAVAPSLYAHFGDRVFVLLLAVATVLVFLLGRK
jgi:hypothetical protein